MLRTGVVQILRTTNLSFPLAYIVFPVFQGHQLWNHYISSVWSN